MERSEYALSPKIKWRLIAGMDVLGWCAVAWWTPQYFYAGNWFGVAGCVAASIYDGFVLRSHRRLYREEFGR